MKLELRSRLALAGGLLGLPGIAGVAVLLGLNRDPVEGSWGLVSVAIFAAPYAIALGSALVERPTVRGPLLLASAVASLLFAGFLFIVGVALLPATVVLFIGTARTLARTGWTPLGALARGFASLAGAAVLVVAVFALYIHDDERCWETIRYPDGSEETRPTERFGGVISLGDSIETSRGTGEAVAGGCTSDVVTAREAAQGLILTSAGVVVLVSVAGLGRRRQSDGRLAAA